MLASTVKTYVPLIVVFISLFLVAFVFLAIKFVYMEHRRIGTIHTPPPIHPFATEHHLSSNASSVKIQDKRRHRHRGLLVGFLGSPAWEINLTSKLSQPAWRRARRREHQPPVGSATRCTRAASTSSSRLMTSIVFTGYASDVDPLLGGSFSAPSRVLAARGPNSTKTFEYASTHSHQRYGDFGECYGVRSCWGSVPYGARRASPSSIRLVDGPGHGDRVEYAFLSGLPPDTVMVSPLMGTRDSIQLSRCSLKRQRTPVPPLPSLPSFLPLRLRGGPPLCSSQSDYLPSLRFPPLAGVAKVFYSQHEASVPASHVADLNGNKWRVAEQGAPCLEPSVASGTPHANDAKSLANTFVIRDTPLPRPGQTNLTSSHRRWQSCRGLAIGGSPLDVATLDDDSCSAPEDDAGSMSTVVRTQSASSRTGSVVSKKPLKSCLRRHPMVPMPTVGSPDVMPTSPMSDSSARMNMLGPRQTKKDPVSLWTATSDGMLGLDLLQ